YVHRGGQPARVDFCIQGITETLRDEANRPLADQSVDLINASGVVGHHLQPDTFRPLAHELQRLLRPQAVAMLEVGPTTGDRELTGILVPLGFQRLGRWRSWALDPTGEVVFRRQ